MSPAEVAYVFVLGSIFGVIAMGALWNLPRFWQWLRFKVWWDYRYSAGYRKGLAHGRTIARRDDSE